MTHIVFKWNIKRKKKKKKKRESKKINILDNVFFIHKTFLLNEKYIEKRKWEKRKENQKERRKIERMKRKLKEKCLLQYSVTWIMYININLTW